MTKLTAADLARWINDYIPTRGDPNRITVRNVNRLVSFVEVQVTGVLLKKQLAIAIDQDGNRSFRLSGGANATDKGKYTRTTGDGDLHFCLGTKNNAVHVPCEIQMVTNAMLKLINDSRGQRISVTGFFRCLFEPGGINQNQNTDCHIFEIHPVRALTIAGETHTFEVDSPDDAGVHDGWEHDGVSLSETDSQVSVQPSGKTLVFSGMPTDTKGGDVNYVRVQGRVSHVRHMASEGGIVRFTFSSDAVGHDLQGICLPYTTASREVQDATGNQVTLTALRNIDLKKALNGEYQINVLAIAFDP